MNLYPDFPWSVDPRGRTAETTYAEHVRDMIEQVLFTTPGERVELPDFGCRLADLVFEPNSPELAAAVQSSASGAAGALARRRHRGRLPHGHCRRTRPSR